MTLTVRQSSVVGAVTKGSPLTYAELDGNFAHLSSAANISTIQAGAVSEPVETFLRRLYFDVKSYGAVGDGTTDDTTAIGNAYTACPAGSTLFFPKATSGYLISSKLTIAKKIRLVFDGGAMVGSGDTPGSYLKKKSTMSTSAVDLTANGIVWEGGGVVGGSDSGDGITVLANNVSLIEVGALSCGGNGIRIGSDTGNNSNSFYIEKPVCSFNGANGIYIHDNTPDANAGTIVQPFCQSNTGDGIKINKAWYNTIISPLCETNTGYGINLGALALRNVIIGGDTNETNTAGSVNITSGAIDNQFIGHEYGTLTDAGTRTLLMGQRRFSLNTLFFGTNPATGGTINLPNGNASQIAARNAANGADVAMIQVDASDFVVLNLGGAAATKNNQHFQPYATASYDIGASGLVWRTLYLGAGTTGVAPLKIPHGSAPTSPVNGDIWTTTSGLFVRINGVTVGPLS